MPTVVHGLPASLEAEPFLTTQRIWLQGALPALTSEPPLICFPHSHPDAPLVSDTVAHVVGFSQLVVTQLSNKGVGLSSGLSQRGRSGPQSLIFNC